LLVSKLERVGQLDARLLCVVTRCTNLWKDWLILLYLEKEILEA
jgi:hypothetical protein